jgi:hypothetical protein
MTSLTAMQHHTCFWGNSRHGGQRRRPDAGSTWSPSPQAPGEPSRARVDAPLALDELIERIGIRFVHCRVPHDPRPFAPSTLVGLCWLRGAPDNGGEGVFTLRYSNCCKRKARRTRSISRPSAVHRETRPYPESIHGERTGTRAVERRCPGCCFHGLPSLTRPVSPLGRRGRSRSRFGLAFYRCVSFPQQSPRADHAMSILTM